MGTGPGITDANEGTAIAFHSVNEAVSVGVRIKGIRAGIGGIYKGPGPGLGPVCHPVIISVGVSGVRAGGEFLKIRRAIVVEVIGS